MIEAPTYQEVIANPDKYEVIWQPDALPNEPPKKGKQYEALAAKEDIVFLYGGKDTGKSDILIWDCLQPKKYTNPRWSGVIFRREYKHLEELIARAHHWFGRLPHLQAHWSGSPHFKFTFPSGAWLAFHNIQHLGDEENYQGWQICDLKFDQLEQFLEPMYNFLLRQNRPADLSLKPTVRATANPLGVGHQWITKRYINKFERSTTNEISTEYKGEKYVRTFRWIHTTVFDNPLAKHDKSRIAVLASEASDTLRRAYLEGDPNVAVGMFFDRFNAEKQVIEPFPIPKEWELVGSVDPGWASPCSFGLQARDFDGTEYRIGTYYYAARTTEEHAKGIHNFIKTNPWTSGRMPSTIVAGTDAFAKKNRYDVVASSKTWADIFEDHGLYLQPAMTDRHQGWGSWKSVMPGKYKIFTGFNIPLVEQLMSVVEDEVDREDIQGKGRDPHIEVHALDDARYGHLALWQPTAPRDPDQPDWFQEFLQKREVSTGWKVGDP